VCRPSGSAATTTAGIVADSALAVVPGGARAIAVPEPFAPAASMQVAQALPGASFDRVDFERFACQLGARGVHRPDHRYHRKVVEVVE